MAEPRPLFPEEPESKPPRGAREPEARFVPRGPADRESAYQGESLGDIARELISDVSALLRTELQLARTEIRNDVSALGQGVVLATVGGVVAFLGVMFLLLAAVFALGATLPLSTAALIVGAVVLIVGVVLALVGVNRLRNTNPLPEETIESLQEDARWLQNRRR